MAAPLAAIIGILVGSATIQHAKDTHQSVSDLDELTYVILAMAVLILVSSLLRKRLFQGITLALFGLAIFNLRFWGFGVPFLLAGAWYLVRAYRLQQALKRARGVAEPAQAPTAPSPPTARGPAEQALHASHLRHPTGLRLRQPARVRHCFVACRPACVRRRRSASTTRTATRTTSKTAGRMKTDAEACSVSTTETGETSVGSEGTAMARTTVPGAWKSVPGRRSL